MSRRDPPTIGLTATRARAADGSLDPSVAPYVRALERYGAKAIVLGNDAGDVDAALARVDGVLASGGADVDPKRYGGNPDHSRAQADRYDDARDDFEIALLRRTRERGVPTLCVCRGLQVATVAFGGTLVEDLVDDFGAAMAIDHRQTNDAGIERSDYAPGHRVRLAAESALAKLVRATDFPTNSMHHQAVRRLGEGLVAVGHTSDGVLEAADATFAHPFFHAVQWHPEELDDAISAALFGGFIAAASATRPVRSDGSATR
ncbi:MAG: gamma-glutamyl-gamma-aminobutyrate hydrolase family protein [Vulcanimicrobiaceae bacterium]